MGFLAGKRLLITGLLNNRSIAYGIARACRAQGAELAFSYQGERFKDRIVEFAAEFDSSLVVEMDVAEDAQIERAFAQLGEAWGRFDGFVHAIGFAPREAIAGEFLDGFSREAFRVAHEISSYSFPAMAKASLEASVRYLAANLGPKGIRVNAISAGPIKTLAASGIKDFRRIFDIVATNSPLRRNVTIDEVGHTAAFLLSDLASGISAEVTYVDGGFSKMMAGGPAEQ